ncbi:hypothetical protein ACFQZX_02270 [Mucilaginibacter litoreus]|uniref:Addiction module component n=1 Tax=Mucilaginibacter litoreus TaxID=1048221 RepID=A0ABW3AMU9_9SPHI
MTVIEIKDEIKKVLDEVPEENLPDVLVLLKELQSTATDKAKRIALFQKIVEEDKEVFQRLAQ